MQVTDGNLQKPDFFSFEDRLLRKRSKRKQLSGRRTGVNYSKFLQSYTRQNIMSLNAASSRNLPPFGFIQIYFKS